MKKISLLLLLFIHFAQAQNKITVAKDGSGNFRTIQGAINSLDSTAMKLRTIFIRNGVYTEKIMLDKSFIRLQGESQSGVIIKTALPRDVWRCENPDDYGAATINVKGSDLVFENLSIVNEYGFIAQKDTVIACMNESGGLTKDRYALPREKGETTGTKIVRKDGHQFAFRSMPSATRLVFKNCTFRAGGGDTISPWNVEGGLYYFKDCTMEGGVDFYCPRGWAFAENCKFICHNQNAAIWHDGSANPDSKTVLKNCYFEGNKGFKLGRFHREAQFYLIGCSFAENMADADIYWVDTAPNQLKWGKRVYYKNCHRTGGDYAWHQDNTALKSKEVNLNWVFGERWEVK